MPRDRDDVICRHCDEVPRLTEDPMLGKYVIECGCAYRHVDVTDEIQDSSLFEPPTGAWCNFDKGSSIYPNENPENQDRDRG